MNWIYPRGEKLPEPGAVPAFARERWLLLWDGECGLCARAARWVGARDRGRALLALPYQEALDWLPEPIRARSARQAHLRAPDGRYWGGGAAVIRLAGLLGHPRLERMLGWPGARQMVELGYRWVAHNRAWIGRWI